ncbi:MAG: hypothetical protein JNK75_05845 [Betaproteobacteria bacterium]|nr:hypothetical protein [Betaproteobacteria bacterium]
MFNAGIRVTVTDRRGALAKLAVENTTADPNSGGDKYAVLIFTLDVGHRMHLAQVMRQLRRLPEGVRIARVKAPAGPARGKA